MGLFRRRAKKNHEKTAFATAQTTTAEEQVEVARREVTAEERPNPDHPGWGQTKTEFLRAHTKTAEEQAEVARREVTAERRPNPDHPGWGQTMGQELGRARANRASQD
jgi:hypothetical protein